MNSDSTRKQWHKVEITIKGLEESLGEHCRGLTPEGRGLNIWKNYQRQHSEYVLKYPKRRNKEKLKSFGGRSLIINNNVHRTVTIPLLWISLCKQNNPHMQTNQSINWEGAINNASTECLPEEVVGVGRGEALGEQRMLSKEAARVKFHPGRKVAKMVDWVAHGRLGSSWPHLLSWTHQNHNYWQRNHWRERPGD